MSEIKNLTVSERQGRWSATWEQEGRHFDMDMLYGYDCPRNYLKLRTLLDENHCIVLPQKEFDLKQNQVQQGFRNVYAIEEVQTRKDMDFSRKNDRHRKVYSADER